MTRSETGLRFRQIREDVLNINQSELSAVLHCSRQHVSRVERGQAEYTFSQLQLFSELIGVPVCSFFDGYLHTEPVAVMAPWMPCYLKMPVPDRENFNLVIVGIFKLIKK